MDSKDDRDKEWSTSLPYALCHFSTSGGAVAVATAFTHPLDVVKVRLQMQLLGQRGPLVGMGETFGRIIKVEGVRGLYLGLVPALTRSTLYGGAFSGALATALTNPMEVLKVRLQMNSRRGLTGEIHKIISEEGFRALWKGVGPAMTRAGALTASQLVTYDESKQALLKWTHLEEGFHLHLISSFVAGTVGTLVTAPVDMLKTRLMLQQDSRGPRIYRNVFHCAYQVVLTEGAGALYKGGFATFARIGPQTTITFLVCEKLRKLAGMNAM
ncbi:mitochondrial substrate carrier family protein ucpB isoform X3 [Dendrobium catenatum]|uniref:mitochondrial substrate carrier family protein ucpB isoform X3 n=1 Tax=Dendrobium catenatum TaxID=906689 RepID=UPI00109FEC34|nr:mitochondrial substrate carrier family protein ucpB isoform X3 [Dendrobium catenatum]